MKIFRNFIVVLIFAFLSFNFLFDFTYINKQINNNLNEFVYKYILFHKNTTNLKTQIKDLKKESNKFERQKKLFEEAFKDLYKDSIETEYNSQILAKIFEQFDPYEFDLDIKKNNKHLEYAINAEHSFSNSKIKTRVYSPQKNILLYGIANQFPASGYLETYNNIFF